MFSPSLCWRLALADNEMEKVNLELISLMAFIVLVNSLNTLHVSLVPLHQLHLQPLTLTTFLYVSSSINRFLILDYKEKLFTDVQYSPHSYLASLRQFDTFTTLSKRYRLVKFCWNIFLLTISSNLYLLSLCVYYVLSWWSTLGLRVLLKLSNSVRRIRQSVWM